MHQILVTGAAGFIGANLVKRLLQTEKDILVVGLDNLNDYYDPKLKDYRLEQLQHIVQQSNNGWFFVKGNLADKALIDSLFEQYQFDVVVNLAAQAGVRNSIDYLEGRLAEVC